MSGLVVNRLSVSHGAIEALRAVSFSVEVGQLAAIIGSNGAGKTTLLRALSGLNNQTSGSAQWNEREILGARPDALVRRGISHVSEGKSVIAELSVKENLILGGIWRSNKSDTSAAIAEVVELSPLVIEQIFATIDQLRRKLGLTVVLVEQNAMSALEIADIGIIINLGEVVASGKASELIDDPALRAAYLGY